MATQILELAKRLVRQEQQIQQLTREHQETLAEYRKVVGGLGNGNGAHSPIVGEQSASLRQRIYGYLKENAGTRLHLAEIERAIGAESEHRRVIWTLANMKRDSVVRHEGRGMWSVGKEDDPEDYKPSQGDDDDIPF